MTVSDSTSEKNYERVNILVHSSTRNQSYVHKGEGAVGDDEEVLFVLLQALKEGDEGRVLDQVIADVPRHDPVHLGVDGADGGLDKEEEEGKWKQYYHHYNYHLSVSSTTAKDE